MFRPALAPELNAAIIRLAPLSFTVRESAPETLRDIISSPRVVYAGGSEHTIYADPAVNWAFRAWHDEVHAKHHFAFDLAGETATCEAQILELLALYPRAPARWFRILRADIIGQVLYLERCGAFPVDQYAFIAATLEHDKCNISRN